ncbi:hypothetical protein LCGC14_0264800 [marine sediment metagenome]|uniref:DOD-type homing endonuclease domain-containing protein n=1 Tax=marine sediment metagenome TaxID=412755 RepID=A0A0F9UHT2_9ZZZZ
MAFWNKWFSKNRGAPAGSYAALDPKAASFLKVIEQRLTAGDTDNFNALQTIQKALKTSAPMVGVPDIGFKGVRQQLFQRFNLIDLYGMAHNLSTLKTAILSLKQEVFRRGLEWLPAFVYRCASCEVDYTQKDLKDDRDENEVCPRCSEVLQTPDPAQRVRFERLMSKVNIFGQSFIRLLQTLEDDLNIVDDAFLFLSSEYTLGSEDGKPTIYRQVKQLYRLDPVFVEFDADSQNRPGMAHHVCLAHRDNLLEVPADEGWEHDWKGRCPIDGYPTFPVMFRYVPMSGAYGVKSGGISTDKESLYIVQGEVIHACYDDQTQVLTKQRGWQYFKDVSDTDVVMTLNQKTDVMEWQKPTSHFEYDGPEFMYSAQGGVKVAGNMLDLNVTPNHNLYVKVDDSDDYELIQAKEAYRKKLTFKLGADWNGEEIEKFILPGIPQSQGTKHDDLPHIEIAMDDWLEFLGWWLAEGSANSHIAGNAIIISQKLGTPTWHRIKALLDRMPFTVNLTGPKFYIRDKRLKTYILETFGIEKEDKSVSSHSRARFVPFEYKNLSQRQLRILFDALINADGCWIRDVEGKEIHGRNREYIENGVRGYFVSSSNRLLDDVQEIALKLGYSARLSKYKHETIHSTTQRVYFDLHTELSINVGHEDSNNRDDFSPNMAESKVYCCEVPNGVLLVRRMGYPVFAGNSKFSPSELYGYSPVLAVYEKALSLIGMDRYLYDYFFERQMPQGVITTVTDNPEDVEIRKEQILAETLNNPHHIPWLAVSSNTGQGKTEFVRFAYSLDELQFLPVQEYLERSVSGVYGVPGLFMGFDSGVGGLNNESQQVIRMSRGAMSSQDVYNTELFPQLLRAFGITDWKLTLIAAEERSDQAEWELKQAKVGWMSTAVSAGFGAKYDPDGDEFELTGEVKPRAEQEAEQAQMYGGEGDLEPPDSSI